MLALLRKRNFALLWLGGLISLLGDRVLMVALPFYVYQQSGSTLATAIMVAADLLPRMLFGSITGVFVDRWDRKKIMFVTSVCQGILLLPLLGVHSAATLWIVYVVRFVQTTLASLFAPAEDALLPKLVGEAELLQANSLNALNNNLARLIGPPVGGVMLTLFGLSGVVLFDSATFIIAAVMILFIRPPATATAPPTPSRRREKAAWARFRQEWAEGLALIARNRVVAVLFLSVILLNFGGVMIDPLFAPFILDVVKAGSEVLGLLLSVQAVGGIVGGLIGGKLSQRLAPVLIYGWGSVAVGLLQIVQYNFPSLPVVYTTRVVIGLSSVIAGAALQTLFQQNVPNTHMGRISGTVSTTMALLSLFGVLGIAGLLAETIGVVPILNFAAAVTILAGALTIVFLPPRPAAPPTLGSEH